MFNFCNNSNSKRHQEIDCFNHSAYPTNCQICPQGPEGPAGQSDTITVRYTITGEAGTSAQVIDTTGSPNHTLDFIIPKGEKGEDGVCPPCTSCICEQQMKYVISQLITKYPSKTATVNVESGGSVSGLLSSVYPTYDNGGLLVLSNSSDKTKKMVQLCRIASISISGANYDDTITYLPTPSDLSTDCQTNCEEAVRQALPVGTEKVNLKLGNVSLGNGNVLKNEFGMIVLVTGKNVNPAFISACKVEIIQNSEKVPT